MLGMSISRPFRLRRRVGLTLEPGLRTLNTLMQPTDIQIIGAELAVKWDDQSESFIPLEKLRRACPCAGCQGERDVMGNLYKNPPQPFTSRSFELLRIANVGGYAIQPVWADGHATGLFSFDYLRRVADAPVA